MSEYVPMLIVAINKNGEYVHIRNAKNDEIYTCPCCGARIKARAMESDKMQPHFYHSEGSECSEENIAHWIYKNWLFGSGCKFFINKDGEKKEYIVDNVSIETSYETKFGIYKPDITVRTISGDTIYFEIYYSNKKDVDNYYCKWNELGNDVVEVNTRELIYSNINQTTPVFNVIYSNGEYLKKYVDKSKRDTYASTIKIYKEAIAKSKCENLKIRFEQLDWFWIILQKYRLQKVEKEEIIELFNIMEFEDMSNCIDLTRRLSCNELLTQFYCTINDLFWININSYIEKINLLYPKKLSIKLVKLSSQKYILDYECKINGSKYHPSYNKSFEGKGTNYNSKSSVECLWNSQNCKYSNLCFKHTKKYFNYDFYKTLIESINSLFNIFENIKRSDIIFKNIQKLIKKSDIWELCIKEDYWKSYYVYYLKIKNQPIIYDNYIYGISLSFEKCYFDIITGTNIRLIEKLPDDLDSYVKNKLILQMSNLTNHINKVDGIDTTHRHFIMCKKEDLNEETTAILHNEISTR